MSTATKLRSADPVGYGRIYLPTLRPSQEWDSAPITISSDGSPEDWTPEMDEVCGLLADAICDPYLTAKPEYYREQVRARYGTRYSPALADPRTIEILVGAGPLVEIECGTGWWTRLVQEAGGDAAAYRRAPEPGTHPSKEIHWTLITEADPADVALAKTEKTLFAVVTPENIESVLRGIAAYSGTTLALVLPVESREAEGTGGGMEVLRAVLSRDWEVETYHVLPSWEQNTKKLTVLHRTTRSAS